MNKNYIDVPSTTTLEEIASKNFTLSATQYKKFCVKNKNLLTVSDFLERKLNRKDLGSEVGSEEYVDISDYIFIKTKALQEESYIISEARDATEFITPQSFIKQNLREGDLLISKDSNVGEIIILDKDYPNAMVCGGIYRLPVKENKYYLLAFIKSNLFRQQIDFLVPRGSTIRHGKTKFLDCQIPMPNKDIKDTINYIECLVKAIVDKEIYIKNKYSDAMDYIENELASNQDNTSFSYSVPTLKEILMLDRMDSALFSKSFKEREFHVRNYLYGTSTIKELGFGISRGQNLQISNIGKSIRISSKREGYYKLILPNYISKYGTITKTEYLGNSSKLKILNKGDLIFGAEGNEKGRSFVVIEPEDNAITNIHGITINHSSSDLNKSIMVKLFLDYYRLHGMIDAYAVGGNGGSMAIKYWNFLKFPNFPTEVEEKIVSYYYTGLKYDPSQCDLSDFLKYDRKYNDNAGIYDIDKSLKYLQNLLDKAINSVANDESVILNF